MILPQLSSDSLATVTASASTSTTNLLNKKNTTSAVWKHFGFEPNCSGGIRDINRPKCRLCLLEVGAKDGNTSNLYSHLKTNHHEVYKSLPSAANSKAKEPNKSSQQPTLLQSWEKTQAYPPTSREHRELTKAVTYFLAKDMFPISTVDKPGFRKMIAQLNPKYKLPGRNYFTRVAIPALAAEVKAKFEGKVSNGDCTYFSGTTDLWTSAANDPYLTFTCHYIDQDWELQSFCLQTHYMPEDHTADNLKEALHDTMELWNLDEANLVAITSDSGSNIKLACRLLQWRRLSCFGHNLNLAVEKGLKDDRVVRALRFCRSVVAAFSRSYKRHRDLAIAQEQKGLPSHKLKHDVVTRWGSAYEMIARLMEQMEAVRTVVANDRNTSHLIPSWQTCDVLDSIVAALKPLKEMTDALSGEKSVTVSAVKPLVTYLTSQILLSSDDDSALTKKIKQDIKIDLLTRYSELDKFLDFTSFLDPRFKLNYATNEEVTLKEVQEQLYPIVDKDLDNDTTLEVPMEEEPPKKKTKGLSKILSNCLRSAPNSSTQTTNENVQQEIERYLQHPKIDMEEPPLQWWKEESKRYPYLAALARKYLCVCATSVPSERIFSSAGHIVSKQRTSLKPAKVDQLVFLAKNL